MTKIIFKQPNGEIVTVDQDEGSLMNAAVANGVEGIDAECGGVCSCATCHIHVHEDWVEKVGPASPAEEALLELEDKANERSRLACQVQIRDELDGLVVDTVGR